MGRVSERIKFTLEHQEKKGNGTCPRLSTCQRMWDLGEKVAPGMWIGVRWGKEAGQVDDYGETSLERPGFSLY